MSSKIILCGKMSIKKKLEKVSYNKDWEPSCLTQRIEAGPAAPVRGPVTGTAKTSKVGLSYHRRLDLESGFSRLPGHPEGPESCQPGARRPSRRSSPRFPSLLLQCRQCRTLTVTECVHVFITVCFVLCVCIMTVCVYVCVLLLQDLLQSCARVYVCVFVFIFVHVPPRPPQFAVERPSTKLKGRQCKA